MGIMINGVTHPAQASAQPTTRGEPALTDTLRPVQEKMDASDAVELSEAAREQIGQNASAPIRTELVERVRAEIAAGTYLTDDKIDAVVDRLHGFVIAAA